MFVQAYLFMTLESALWCDEQQSWRFQGVIRGYEYLAMILPVLERRVFHVDQYEVPLKDIVGVGDGQELVVFRQAHLLPLSHQSLYCKLGCHIC